MTRSALPCLLLLLSAGRSFAAPIYPVSARLTLAPREEQRCLALDRGTDCAIIDSVRGAFEAVTARMFRSSGTPDLQLVVSVKRAELSRVAGLALELEVRVRILSPSGESIDELELYGSGQMLEAQPAALAHAQREAADEAAARFERAYANSRKAGDYLVGKKIAPASQVAVPERGENVFWLALGVGAVFGGGDDNFAIAPSLRAAFSSRHFFLQGMLSHYSSSFLGVEGSGVNNSGSAQVLGVNSTLSATDLGLEAGVVFRLTPDVDLRLGPGVHFLAGSGGFDDPGPFTGTTPSSSYTKLAPTAAVSLSTSFIAFHGGPRILVGAEARGYFFATVDLPEVGRSVPVASSYIGIFAGLEWAGASHTGGAP